ncbi:uncharacterized protein LOC123538280 isoform X3 [Mercenaria mercenaria]|uniref:uncharacterized protein LOC123538280 isoform X3 n=1 Tax=Mercenaria mercenaria TaxID=6596 RepID=UPI00234F3C36|nr:uncharacterized protein LOC123538280 isoform X3 [Mercenaria mercenaria]
MTQLSKIARWDKLKSWKVLNDEIEDKLKSAEKFDHGMTLDIGPQLLYTLRHPSALRCMDHTSSKLGEIFTCHYNKGAVQGVRVWLVESRDKDGACKNKGFETDCEITCMTYVSKHRAYLVFCSDLTLRVFTDARSNFVEIACIQCLSTILCLVYNKEDDEVYAGGIGCIEEWKVLGAEHAASVVPGRKFFTDLSRNDWIRDIKIVKENDHLIAQHGNGLCVVHFKSRKQMHRIPNKHDGPLTCCCYYPQNDFLITGGSDGKIRVFNGTVFNLLLIHVFIGHHGLVSDLEPHQTEALLFSSSHDGTVRIWRLDSMQLFMRLDIGEKIFCMSLLSDTEFYFRTEKDVMIYNCNQFYQFFAPVESETKRLMCCRGIDRPNRILASTEDGSVRLFSPITGLTLTVIYPMPSFQVLMSFAYDIHQDRLHTVLTGGKVIVYNTATNPCKAEELWTPKSEDERVNILLLVSVEFPCEDGTDADNLVFAGLENGQIILSDAIVCSLNRPVQAHEGAVICLENCLYASGDRPGSGDTSAMILSGGTDKFVKVWKVLIDASCRRPIVRLSLVFKVPLPSIPQHICMYSMNLWVSIQAESKKGKIWKLVLYRFVQIGSKLTELGQMKNLLNMKYVLTARQMTHQEDEDHVAEMTSIDLCPFLNIVMTSGKDGFVKIWSGQNELIREMNFATPIYATCFANNRGDILVGYGTHICSISVANYLPLDYLKEVSSVTKSFIEDDVRELPVKFDNKSEPWLDICKLKQYSVDIVDRRRQRLEEEVIAQLKKVTQKASTKFVIFVEGNTTKVIRKDFADKLLVWAKGKQKLKFGVKTADITSLLAEARSDTDSKAVDSSSQKRKKSDAAASKQTKAESSVKEEEKVFFDSEGLLEIYPSAVGKALQDLKHKKVLGPEEMRLLKEQELLKKDPIIAPDGYIPNSVIRKKLKPPKVDVRRAEKPFKLKPVPKPNPQHMPAWWVSEEDKEGTTHRLEYRVMKWDDSPSPTPKSEISSVSSVSLKSLIESPVKKYIAEGRSKTISPKSPKSKSESKSRNRSVSKSRNDTTPIENVKKMIKANDKNKKAGKSGWDDSSHSGRPDTDMLSRSKLTSGLSDRQRSSTTLSDSLKTGSKPATYKSGSAKSRVSSGTESVKSKRLELSRIDLEMRTPDSRRGRRSGAQSEAREKSFKLTNYAVDEDSSAIHVKETKSGRRLKSHMSHVIITQLLEEEWMPDMEGDYEFVDIINKLVTVLDRQRNPVIYDSACTYVSSLFNELGFSEDQLDQIISKLGVNLDSFNKAIQMYSMRTLQDIGHGRNDVLLLILPKLVDLDESIRGAAVEAIRVLTAATDKETLLSFLETVGITSTEYRSKPDEEYTLALLAEKFAEHLDPIYFERILNWVEGTTPGMFDREEEDMWQDSSISRKEHSFLSEGKSVIDMYDTSGRNTMYADIPTTPGSYSDNDELIFSRGVSMHDAKSVGIKSEKSRFNARMDLLDRAGASVYPGERVEQPTPLSDLMGDDVGNDVFLMDDHQSPFMQDPLLNFDQEPLMSLDQEPLMSLDQEPVLSLDQELLSREKSNVSGGTVKGSPISLENLLLKERTLTDLSQVGPLPNFMPRDNTGRNFDEISTDSAFESAISVSEYDTSHFSEKWTMSHADQQSSKHSQISDENNMFDVEQVSILEYEGKKDGPLTPRSRGTASTFRKRMKETDGFSTISDRSSSSRKSRRSGRQDTQSEVQSRASTDHGVPLPYTLPGQVRDAVLSGTSSGKSQLKISKKLSPKDDLQEAAESDAESYQTSVTASTEDPIKPAESPQTIKKEPKIEAVEKAKTVGTEPTTVSIDTNTGSIETQPVSKGTPVNSPETPFATNEMVWSTQEVLVTNDNQQLEPITEDIENASFLKTPRAAESAIPMESTAIDDSVAGENNDTEKLQRFTPRDPNLFKYYENMQDAQSDKQVPKEVEPELEPTGGKIQDKDSGFKTISDITSSQITDRLSGYDSGISKDMSEFSHGRTLGRGFAHAPLSPVKSESTSPTPHLRLQSPKDWRKFFDMIPNAQERRQMEQIRREMEQGKLKHPTLPPISYFAEDLPMLPGEAGTRLLRTVRVGEKVQVSGDGRHRIEPVPGKLAVHTQNEDAGLSNFGILQMQWTTGVPTVKDRIHPPQRIPQHRSHKMIRPDMSQELYSANGLNRMRHGISEEELHLPFLESASPQLTNQHTPNHYEWEFPLPPPPAKESRTEVPQIRKDHDSYCKYYHLVKKKLHLYTSPLGFIPALIDAEKARPKPKQQKEKTQHLPELFVKRIRDKDQHPTSGEKITKKRSLTKSDIISSVMFPPIKLGQLVNIG